LQILAAGKKAAAAVGSKKVNKKAISRSLFYWDNSSIT
jgi:hypothetical protein